MTTVPTPWPSSEEYNLAHRCPRRRRLMAGSESPDIVYGRLLESAHISGYGFERMVDELEWLLDNSRAGR